MKKAFMFLMISMLAVITVSAQTTYPSEKITVNTSDLTIDQLAKIKAEQEIETLQKKLDTYGNWVGVGGEIGTAVKEGLTAVVDVADKFGKTDVGKFTLVMVAWKVMGKDIVRIFLGLIFITTLTIFMFRIYRKTFTAYRIETSSNGLRFWLPKTYSVITPERWEGYEAVKILFIVMYAGGIGLTYAIMFG
jgi:hypothetical protein